MKYFYQSWDDFWIGRCILETMLFVGILFLILFTIWIVHLIRGRKRALKYMGKFDGPPRNVIFGVGLNIPTDPVDIFKLFTDHHKVYGKNFAVWGILNDFGLTIGDPKDVETILSSTKSIMKSWEYSFLHDWLGEGLLVSDGKKWHSRRKIITPTFHFKVLEQFIDIFNKQTTNLVGKVEEYSRTGKECDVYKFTTLCALDIICEASMGITINAQDDPESEYVKAVKEMSLIIFRRIFSLTNSLPWLFPFTSMYRDQKKYIKILHAFTDKIIRQRRDLLQQKMNENDSKPEDENKKLNFLDLLLQATDTDGKPLTNADIREEVDTFMFEGHDTTTSGVAFTLYHLSKHPEIQQRVYEEVISLVDADSPYFTYAILQDLKYLEMVIKESLRMTPPVPIIGRKLEEDTVIQGINVPSETRISIPIFAMHNFEDVFPESNKFDPERFSLENSRERHPFAYIPFSAGPRNCIGQKFAMLEIKTVVAKMLLNYKLVPVDSKYDLRLQADLVLKSTTGMHLKLSKR